MSFVVGPDVRLVDGPTPYEGRVEVLYNGEWGPVCHYSTTTASVRAMCKSLGFSFVYVKYLPNAYKKT